MSFHPESHDGFDERCRCPYCGSSNFQYEDAIGNESGISSYYLLDQCICDECGKKFVMTSIVETTEYGSMPYESYFGKSNENRRPKAKGKAPTKKGTNKPSVKKKPTTKKTTSRRK